MSWHNIKIFPVDIAFSRYIRLKHKKCQKCGRLGEGDEGIHGLEASHYFSRGKWGIRFDENNVDCLCKSDHLKFHKHPYEYDKWKLEQLGKRDFDLLTVRAWAKSDLGSGYWKKLTKKQAEELFNAAN